MEGSNSDRISTRSDFQVQVRCLIGDAAQAGASELWLVDVDFADWPLNERELVADLVAWARPQRRLNMLAHRFDEVLRVHPRFVTWRRDFGHLVQCRQVDVDASDTPTLLITGPGTGLQLVDRQRFRGRRFTDEADIQAWREVIDALMQRSQDAFPATTLGI